MPVIADYTFKMFLTSIFYRRGPLNVTGPGLTYSTLLFFLTGLGNVLIKALKN